MSSNAPADYGRIARWHRQRGRVPKGKSWRARALRAERHVRSLRDRLARLRAAVEQDRRRAGGALQLAVQTRATADEIRRLEAQEGTR